MKIRYYAAAAAAAGLTEEQVSPAEVADSPVIAAEADWPEGSAVTLSELLDYLVARHEPGRTDNHGRDGAAGAPAEPAARRKPSLARVIARSSFLVNEVSVRDRTHTLKPDDVVDILPPFAGG